MAEDRRFPPSTPTPTPTPTWAPPRLCPNCGESTYAADGTPCTACAMLMVDPRLHRRLGGGKYEVERLIGAGGWGRVYAGRHLSLGEPVAIKFLSPSLTNQPSYRERFRREAVALARLRHPGIVSVHDFGEEDGESYMVMELLRGESLAEQVLVHEQTMPVERAVGIIEQVLQVLEAAHGLGIVHRDLKPENIMLLNAGDRLDRVKVLDFGLALLSDPVNRVRLTAAQVVHGTPTYMAPEQCRGEAIGPPADIYAVGVILFELLAGIPPFTSTLASDLMVRHMYIQPPPIGQVGVRKPPPPALEALVRWALAKRPTERPSAAQLRDALREALRGADAVSLRERAADERQEQAALGRAERALPLTQAATVPLWPPPPGGEGEGPRVVLWGLAEEEATALQDALAVHGVVAVRAAAGSQLPPATVDGRAVVAVLLPGAGAAERIRRVRFDPGLSRVPLLALGVEEARHTPELIRVGVSDVALRGTPTDTVCRQVWRLLRRGR